MRNRPSLVLVLVTLWVGAVFGCAQGESRAIRRRDALRANRHLCRMALRWDGDPKDLRVIVRLENTETVPISVDRELVFFVVLYVFTPKNMPVEFEMVRRVPKPSPAEVTERVVELAPGEALERRVDLQAGFKCFEWSWPDGNPMSVVSAEVMRRVPEGADVSFVTVDYAPPESELLPVISPGPGPVRYYRSEPINTMNYGLPPELFRGEVLGSKLLNIPGG